MEQIMCSSRDVVLFPTQGHLVYPPSQEMPKFLFCIIPPKTSRIEFGSIYQHRQYIQNPCDCAQNDSFSVMMLLWKANSVQIAKNSQVGLGSRPVEV